MPNEKPLEVVGTVSKESALVTLDIALDGGSGAGFSAAAIPNDICGLSPPNIDFDKEFIGFAAGDGLDIAICFSTASFGFGCDGVEY